MNLDDQSTRDPLVRPHLPWWLGRGVGLALLAMVVAVGWTVAWGIASQVGTAPRDAAAAWPEIDAYDVAAVSSRTDADRAEGTSGAVVTDRPTENPEPAAEPAESSGQDDRTGPTDHALQAEVLAERERARTRRALEADRELAEFIESVGVLSQLDAWVAPISGSYRITATFGQAGSLWSSDHTGVDLAAPSGTPVSSVAAGTVTRAGDAGAYGLQVEITHADGSTTSYSHLSRVDVTVGQVVTQGAVIGAVGSTGNSTGPHLHLEVRPAGAGPVDPVHALLARGVVL